MLKEVLKKTILFEAYKHYKLYQFRNKWLKRNMHNQTIANNFFNIDLVEVGNASYGELNVISFANKCRLYIGNYVSIAQEVVFLLDVEHRLDCISTYPFKVKTVKLCKAEAFGKGDIIVDDDVWIGYRAIILSGVHLGKGAIIAAGAVVTKDVPPYAIVGGNPAKVIKYRFDKNIIDKLMEFDFEKLENDFVKENIDRFYESIDNLKLVKEMVELQKTNDFEKNLI